MMTSYLIGILGIVALMIGWTIVQTLWRKVFAEHLSDEDVMADRSRCGNCACTTICRDPSKRKNESQVINR